MNSRTLIPNVFSVKFQNNHVVYENFTKCVIKDYEFNYTYNPTILSGSQGVMVPFSASDGGDIVFVNTGSAGIIKEEFTLPLTGSEFSPLSTIEFSPYVTAVGLYNDSGDLLAVGKMSAPMPLSSNTDVTFLIKWDTQWKYKPYFSPIASPSLSASPTPTISITPTRTPTISKTPSITPSVTPTRTPSVTITPTVTATKSIPVSLSQTPTITPSTSIFPSFSNTPTVTPTRTPTPTISRTPSVTPSRSIPSGGCRCYSLENTTASPRNVTYTICAGPSTVVSVPALTKICVCSSTLPIVPLVGIDLIGPVGNPCISNQSCADPIDYNLGCIVLGGGSTPGGGIGGGGIGGGGTP